MPYICTKHLNSTGNTFSLYPKHAERKHGAVYIQNTGGRSPTTIGAGYNNNVQSCLTRPPQRVRLSS